MHGFFASRFGGQHHGCIGRHGRHHGVGSSRAPWSDDDAGWQGFRSGRKLRGDELQLVILALLAEAPAHGYEIIKALGQRSGGFYSPSPGMVYPALTYLEEIGYATVESEGTRKQYRISETGRAHLDANRGTADTMLAQLRWLGEKMAHVRQAFSGARADADSGADAPLFGRHRRRWMSSALYQAGLELKAALFEQRDASEETQRRIAEILRKAAAAVKAK